MTEQIGLEQIEEFMDMLAGGELPEGILMPRQPQLSRGEAFSVIWFLQEHLRVLDDSIEICRVCEELFDHSHGGFIVDGSDEPDDWHRDIGVTSEMLKQNDGSKFCSSGCEYQYWAKVREESNCYVKAVAIARAESVAAGWPSGDSAD